MVDRDRVEAIAPAPAQRALELSLDPTVAPPVQLNAAGRFQAIVRQLALVTRPADAAPQPASISRAPVQRTARADPRALLLVVK